MVYVIMLVLLLPSIFLTNTMQNNNILDQNQHFPSLISRGNACSKYTIQPAKLFLLIWIIYMIVIMGLRGNFTSDYKSYTTIFYRISGLDFKSFWSTYGFQNLFSMYIETGYAFINFIICKFTDNSIWIFIISSICICVPNYKLFVKQNIPWLSALLWISIGPYLESFNTMRGIMAAAILIYSLKYMHNRKFLKYTLVVLSATLIHSISIIMLFVYFLPLIKPSKKSIFIMGSVAIASASFGEAIAVYFNQYFYIAKDAESAIELLHRNNSMGLSLIAPTIIVFLGIIIYFHNIKYKTIDSNNVYVRILFNGTLIWIILSLLMLFSAYMTRFAALFSYYPYIFVPYMISKVENRRSRNVYILIIASIAIAWFLLNVFLRYPTYYFANL